MTPEKLISRAPILPSLLYGMTAGLAAGIPHLQAAPSDYASGHGIAAYVSCATGVWVSRKAIQPLMQATARRLCRAAPEHCQEDAPALPALPQHPNTKPIAIIFAASLLAAPLAAAILLAAAIHSYIAYRSDLQPTPAEHLPILIAASAVTLASLGCIHLCLRRAQRQPLAAPSLRRGIRVADPILRHAIPISMFPGPAPDTKSKTSRHAPGTIT